MSDRQIQRGQQTSKQTTIAHMSAEDTAAFFSGEAPPEMTYDDPRIAQGIARQKARLRRALFDEITPSLIKALHEDSPQTARRLQMLAEQTKRGDLKLYAALVSELLSMAVRP